MRFSRFFIDRPIFAAVLSLLITIAGGLALLVLPVSEYPNVIPPTVVVNGVYPGANPKVIAETVASPLEQEINGVEGMLYMFSQSTADGRMTLTITFELGTDLDKAQVQVQNRVAQALPRLPLDVQRIGVTTEKASPDLMMVVHLVSPSDRYDMLYLSNYAHLQVKDELSRIPGVGNVQVFGAGEYSMRVWVDPDRLAARQLTATDVVRAIREQNVQVAAGVLGAPPAPSDTSFQLLINAQGRLSTEEEFADIVVRASPDGQITRIRDIGRVELGSNMYALRSLLDNRQAVAIGISQRPDSNALDASAQVRAVMERLKQQFPEGVDYSIVYDPTVYVRASVRAVIETLFEAILLVVIVVLVFLQTWRASIIPLVAVPVSLIGTFAVMLAFGFSLNTLSLFGLVLSIGIVVDDAIVVVENVERHIGLGLTPIEATRKAMDEVSGPIIAIALVLCAVFIPTAFVGGLTGQFYRQFALTIAISTVISAINSLTLSPALASRLLQPHDAERDRTQRVADRLFGWFFRGFNRFFGRASEAYGAGVARVLRFSAAVVVLYAGLVGLTAVGFSRVPEGFIPTQDKDYLVAFAQLPDAATLDRTDAVIRRMSDIALAEPGVRSSVAFPGLSVNGFVNASNVGIAFVMLDAPEERTDPARSAASIVQRLNQKFASIQDAYVAVFPPPPIQGLGSIGGFKLYVEDRAGLGFEELYARTQGAIMQGYTRPELAGLLSSFQVNVPQIDARVDRERAKTYGVPLTDVFDTLQVYLGSLYVNDFNRFGRTYQVNVQAASEFRLQPEQIRQLKTRTAGGAMVPLGSLVAVGQGYGPDQVMHYNGFPAAEINGGPGPGFSSGESEAAIADVLSSSLPAGMTFEWTELAYQKLLAGNTLLFVFPLCVLLVYVVLAAQYESWSLPLSVILIVPMTLFSAIAGVWLTGGDNNVFTQISFLVLAGLACKNAILIIEFAKRREEDGESPVAAILEACRVRLRPVLMTSVAFIMGVVPLVFSSGAGAEIRQAMGVAVFSGMLGVTIFGLFLTPVFFITVGRMASAFTRRRPAGRAVLATTATILVAVVLAGCGVRRPYVAPSVAPAALAGAANESFSAAPYDGAWWRQFEDPVLDALQDAALQANHDVRIAIARVEQARAIFRDVDLDRYPTAVAGAAVDVREQAVPGFADEPVRTNTYQAGFDAFWEIDVFGRVRSAVAAARADAEAVDASLEDVRVSVAAEVARQYFELRGLQRQLDVAERSLANQRETLRLTELRRDAGLGEEQDVASAAARVAAIDAEIPALRSAIAARENRLAVLIGVRPGAAGVDLAARAYPPLATALPIGDPAALLRQRPDVRAAERALAAATAREGIAAADLFPRVTVTGFLGLLAGRGNVFGSSDSRAWAVTPSLSWAALDLGSARARLRGAEAQTREVLAVYERQVLRALEEAETALVAYAAQQQRLVRLGDQARESGRAAAIARTRYKEGVVDFLELLDAERTALAAQDAVARAEAGLFIGAVSVYKALGGI